MNTPGTVVTREELVARARQLGPAIAERTLKTEELRRVPEETFQEFKDAGLLRVFIPKAHGGYGLDLGTVIETTRELGQYCGSSSWCLAICSLHNWMVSNFPAAAQEEVYGSSRDPVVCGVFMPGGTAKPVDGGYRLTGQWDFASASDHAGHAILAGLIQADSNSPPSGLGNFLVRRQDFEIEDNWFVSGLVGSGSKRVVVKDVFVPSDWAMHAAKGSASKTSSGSRGTGNDGTKLPFNSVATLGLVGVPLGIARGALDGFRERLASKVRVGTFRSVEKQVGAQLRLAESAAEVDCVELLALRDADEMERTLARGEPATQEQRGRYRRDAAYVFQVCAKAVQRLMPASGAHAIFLDAPQQRALRDTQAMGSHIVADWDLARESYARAMLGIPPEDPVF